MEQERYGGWVDGMEGGLNTTSSSQVFGCNPQSPHQGTVMKHTNTHTATLDLEMSMYTVLMTDMTIECNQLVRLPMIHGFV